MDRLESSDALAAQYSAFSRTDPQALHKLLCGCGYDVNALASHLAVHPLVIARYIKERGGRGTCAESSHARERLLLSPRSLSRQVSGASDLAENDAGSGVEGARNGCEGAGSGREGVAEEEAPKRPVRVGLLQFPVRSTSADLQSDHQCMANSCVKISCA